VLDPGVADQQIQAAELGYHRADQPVGLRHVADICRECRRGAPAVAEFADERVGGCPIGSIVDRDRGSLGGQPPHDRGADSAAASGDQDPLARQA
jgi:hypothetical protein